MSKMPLAERKSVRSIIASPPPSPEGEGAANAPEVERRAQAPIVNSLFIYVMLN
jgi:hypothetical protein